MRKELPSGGGKDSWGFTSPRIRSWIRSEKSGATFLESFAEKAGVHRVFGSIAAGFAEYVNFERWGLEH